MRRFFGFKGFLANEVDFAKAIASIHLFIEQSVVAVLWWVADISAFEQVLKPVIVPSFVEFCADRDDIVGIVALEAGVGALELQISVIDRPVGEVVHEEADFTQYSDHVSRVVALKHRAYVAIGAGVGWCRQVVAVKGKTHV